MSQPDPDPPEIRTAGTGRLIYDKDQKAIIHEASTDLAAQNALLAQVAALRAELECVEASAPQIHGDGKTRERSWGLSYPLERVRKLLAGTEAAASAYRQQIENAAVAANMVAEEHFCGAEHAIQWLQTKECPVCLIEQQAREQERDAAIAILDKQIQREHGYREQAAANSNWRDAEIADHRRLALLAAYDEFQAAIRARGGEPAP